MRSFYEILTGVCLFVFIVIFIYPLLKAAKESDERMHRMMEKL